MSELRDRWAAGELCAKSGLALSSAIAYDPAGSRGRGPGDPIAWNFGLDFSSGAHKESGDLEDAFLPLSLMLRFALTFTSRSGASRRMQSSPRHDDGKPE